jgi:hypothetical protein
MQGALGPMELKPLGSASPTPPNSLGDWRAIVSKSLGRAGISQKVAAADLGVTEAALSKQLAGAEHLSFWRMHSLPPEFWHELVLLIVEFHGLTIGAASQRDLEDAAIGRCVRDAVSRCR